MMRRTTHRLKNSTSWSYFGIRLSPSGIRTTFTKDQLATLVSVISGCMQIIMRMWSISFWYKTSQGLRLMPYNRKNENLKILKFKLYQHCKWHSWRPKSIIQVNWYMCGKSNENHFSTGLNGPGIRPASVHHCQFVMEWQTIYEQSHHNMFNLTNLKSPIPYRRCLITWNYTSKLNIIMFIHSVLELSGLPVIGILSMYIWYM